jgi:hypothetical protein
MLRSSKFLLSVAKPKNIQATYKSILTNPAFLIPSYSLLAYTQTYNFAKVGKKEEKKKEHQEEKKEANLPKDIDLNQFEEKMKKDIEDLKVISRKTL